MPSESSEFQLAGMLERMKAVETTVKRIEDKLDLAGSGITDLRIAQARVEAQTSYFSKWVKSHDEAHRFIITAALSAAAVAVAALAIALHV